MSNVMKKYKVRIDYRWGAEAKIEKVEVEKETNASVWINGSRNSKRSAYANYYDTWEEARRSLMSCQRNYVNALRMRLERAKVELGNINGMKK